MKLTSSLSSPQKMRVNKIGKTGIAHIKSYPAPINNRGKKRSPLRTNFLNKLT